VPLVLKEKHGTRQLILELSPIEARVIAREQGQRITGEQPQVYDLWRDVIRELGGRSGRRRTRPHLGPRRVEVALADPEVGSKFLLDTAGGTRRGPASRQCRASGELVTAHQGMY
jgi:hypothetical protein